MTAALHVGDLVMIPGYESSYPGVWKIIKVNPTRYRLEPINGGRGLACPHSMVAAHDGDVDAAPAVRTFTPRAPFSPGEVVTLVAKPGLFVVLADKDKRVNVVRLGGDAGRYWRVPPSSLTRVDVVEIPRLMMSGALDS
jgi:hypothetical protein